MCGTSKKQDAAKSEQHPTTKTAHLEHKRLTFKEECIHQSKSMRLFCDQQQFRGAPWQIPCYKWYHCLRTASAGLRLAQEDFSFLEYLKTCSRLLEASGQLTGTESRQRWWLEDDRGCGSFQRVWCRTKAFPFIHFDKSVFVCHNWTLQPGSIKAGSNDSVLVWRTTPVSLRIVYVISHKCLVKELSNLNTNKSMTDFFQ